MINSTRCAILAKQACTTFSQVVCGIISPNTNNFLKYFVVLFASLTLNAATAWAATDVSEFTSKEFAGCNSTTVTPNAAYTYGNPAYTIKTGKASVNQSENTFTVTPTANCTIQINMVQKTTADITFENMGGPAPATTGYYVGDTYTLPSENDFTCGDKTFVGWSTVPIDNSVNKPTTNFYEPSASVTLQADNIFYAVFAEGGGEIHTSIAGGDWSNGVPSGDWRTNCTETYSSGNGVKFDHVGDYVLSPNISSKNYTELLLKLKSGHNGGEGSVLTFYAYDVNGTLLKDGDVVITPETIVPTESYTSQNTIYEVSVSASEIIGFIMIMMTSRTNNLGMKYCEVFGVSSSYQNYTTECTAQTYSVTKGTVQNCTVKFSETDDNIDRDELTELAAGDYAYFTITPNSGYKLNGAPIVKDASNQDVECIEVDNIWMFQMPASNITVSVSCSYTLVEITEGDNTEVLNNYTGQPISVEVTRQFTPGSLYTISLPFTLENVSSVFGNQAYEYTSLAKDGDDVVLYFNKVNTIEAGKPYLIEPTKDVHGFSVDNVTLSNATNYISFGVGTTTVDMEAVLSAGEDDMTDGKYWLALDRYLYNNETRLLGLRAVFNINSASGIAPRARVAFRENTTTGLSNITNDENTTIKVIENGQLIIIRNGEKFNAQGIKF